MKSDASPIRCFVAIELSQEARSALSRLQERLKAALPKQAIRWTAPQNIHLTLHFLGDVAAEELPVVSRVVRDTAAAISPFSLVLTDLGCFPHARKPRVVWVSVSGDTEDLVRLHRELGTGLKSAIGFEPESRPYSPHLTIGRVKKGIPPERLIQLGRTLEEQIPTVGTVSDLPVNRVHFIRSELTPAGPLYTRIDEGEMAGNKMENES